MSELLEIKPGLKDLPTAEEMSVVTKQAIREVIVVKIYNECADLIKQQAAKAQPGCSYESPVTTSKLEIEAAKKLLVEKGYGVEIAPPRDRNRGPFLFINWEK